MIREFPKITWSYSQLKMSKRKRQPSDVRPITSFFQKKSKPGSHDDSDNPPDPFQGVSSTDVHTATTVDVESESDASVSENEGVVEAASVSHGGSGSSCSFTSSIARECIPIECDIGKQILEWILRVSLGMISIVFSPLSQILIH